jgi:hypothetical protein
LKTTQHYGDEFRDVIGDGCDYAFGAVTSENIAGWREADRRRGRR